MGCVAADWSDVYSFSNPPLSKGGPCADPEASWGHRKANTPGSRDELFFGYFFQVATMVADEDGHGVPELARRMLGLVSCRPTAGRSVLCSRECLDLESRSET
jgi:hypothetical protein